ncbi:MAG: hypothetical protein KKB51_04110 [Candidatus Riflebacteria bacterium]|nr:hypothetical protein [Candidatus Riflebacteria bacterium]
MKMEHIELVWESLAQFERERLTFGDFLEHLGKSLESADIMEAKIIGEAARELDFALATNPNAKIKVTQVIGKMKSRLMSRLKATAN